MPSSKHKTSKRRQRVSRQRSDETAAPPLPEITKESAWNFVRLMHAGLPAADAISYIHTTLDKATCAVMAKTWLASQLAFDATIKYTKGAWHELTPDTRIELARDKFVASQAYILYTGGADANVSAQHYAYQVICEYLKATGSSEKDPLRDFYRDEVSKLDAEEPDAKTSH